MCDDYCEGIPCRDYDDCQLVKDIRKPCPECGGKPTIETAQWGNAYFALCESCGWEGGVRQVESTPFAALSHWPSKFLNT